jgi:hypothetical protein
MAKTTFVSKRTAEQIENLLDKGMKYIEKMNATMTTEYLVPDDPEPVPEGLTEEQLQEIIKEMIGDVYE